jgi:peptide alpha-N-acetyltransferase
MQMRFVAFLFISLQEPYTDSDKKITLETEIDNIPSLKLYERLGFLRTKRLHRYYLNGNSAYRMILYLKEGVASKQTQMPYDPPY